MPKSSFVRSRNDATMEPEKGCKEAVSAAGSEPEAAFSADWMTYQR
jgi:hypothetical protein